MWKYAHVPSPSPSPSVFLYLTHAHTHTHTHTHTHSCTHAHTHIHKNEYITKQADDRTLTYSNTHIYRHTYTQTLTYSHTCIYRYNTPSPHTYTQNLRYRHTLNRHTHKHISKCISIFWRWCVSLTEWIWLISMSRIGEKFCLKHFFKILFETLHFKWGLVSDFHFNWRAMFQKHQKHCWSYFQSITHFYLFVTISQPFDKYYLGTRLNLWNVLRESSTQEMAWKLSSFTFTQREAIQNPPVRSPFEMANFIRLISLKFNWFHFEFFSLVNISPENQSLFKAVL